MSLYGFIVLTKFVSSEFPHNSRYYIDIIPFPTLKQQKFKKLVDINLNIISQSLTIDFDPTRQLIYILYSNEQQ